MQKQVKMIKKILILTGRYQENETVFDYCKNLAQFLGNKNIETHIICFDDYTSDETADRFHLHKISFMLDGNNLFNWTMLMNNEIKRKARELFESIDFDVIHVNDWTAAPAGMTIAKLTGKPLILTLHSTEHERGFMKETSEVISSVEWWATYEASHVFVHNPRTVESVKEHLKLPEGKVTVLNTKHENWQEKIEEVYEMVIN